MLWMVLVVSVIVLLLVWLFFVLPIRALIKVHRSRKQKEYELNKAFPQTRWARFTYYYPYVVMLFHLHFVIFFVVGAVVLVITSMFQYERWDKYRHFSVGDLIQISIYSLSDVMQLFAIISILFGLILLLLPPYARQHWRHRMRSTALLLLQAIALLAVALFVPTLIGFTTSPPY